MAERNAALDEARIRLAEFWLNLQERYAQQNAFHVEGIEDRVCTLQTQRERLVTPAIQELGAIPLGLLAMRYALGNAVNRLL